MPWVVFYNRFHGDVQFNNNDASLDGGGLAVEGGDVT